MAFSKKLNSLIDFIDFTHQFREVLRIARIPNDKRWENDSEHSYQLAMVAWFLIEQDKLKLNKELCLMYALAHDLVEIYAGDTYAFSKQDPSIKHKKEKEALKKIKNRFKGFKTLSYIIENYEHKKDDESKFIYALDKILPPIQVYMENGLLYKQKKVGLEDVLQNKNPKIALSKNVEIYWNELVKEFKKNKTKYFPK
jgi:putative hydrolase of HD superfamily